MEKEQQPLGMHYQSRFIVGNKLRLILLGKLGNSTYDMNLRFT